MLLWNSCVICCNFFFTWQLSFTVHQEWTKPFKYRGVSLQKSSSHSEFSSAKLFGKIDQKWFVVWSTWTFGVLHLFVTTKFCCMGGMNSCQAHFFCDAIKLLQLRWPVKVKSETLVRKWWSNKQLKYFSAAIHAMKRKFLRSYHSARHYEWYTSAASDTSII